ncbi:MAG: tripartite tricarboxylate transporter TctB family protein [Rhodospirillaceae bacterium]|nr:tripartite tricarboxylate transporter TctB family protein [Rhodospirillaceae bacterium]
MSHQDDHDTRGISVRTADIVVALILIAVGVAVIVDSLRLGIGWSESGPQSGYFPFYIGVLIVLSSLGTIGVTLFGRRRPREVFVEREQLVRVLKVLVPSAIFVAAIGFIGIYVATAIFIAAFMLWLGRFRWYTVAAVSIVVPVALFLLFEIWFLVPLPKGPLESALGY